MAEMELEAPQRVSDQTYMVNINTESNITVQYSSRETGSHTSPPDNTDEIQAFLRILAPQYEALSKRWFHNEIGIFAFMKRITHHWEFGSHAPYMGQVIPVQVRQTWCPEKLQILPRSIQLHWKLVDVSYEIPGLRDGGGGASTAAAAAAIEEVSLDSFSGGGTSGFGEIDLHLSGVRERALRKVREARLRAAVARWHANELLVRYYERYGTTELLDGDSELSSDDEATQTAQPENKK